MFITVKDFVEDPDDRYAGSWEYVVHKVQRLTMGRDFDVRTECYHQASVPTVYLVLDDALDSEYSSIKCQTCFKEPKNEQPPSVVAESTAVVSVPKRVRRQRPKPYR